MTLPTGSSDRVLDRVHAALPDLTKRERRVAQVLMASYPVIGLETVSSFAEKAGVSTATVLRFVNKLGFPVYAGFQAALRAQLEATLQSPLLRFEGPAAADQGKGGFLADYIESSIANLQDLQSRVPAQEFERVVEILADERRDVVVLGGRYTSNVGRYLVDFLKALRPRVTYVEGQTQKWAPYLLDVKRSTALVVFDARRYQPDVIRFSQAAAEKGATVILFTDPWHSEVARVAHHLLAYPVSSASLFDSSAAALVLVEALQGAVALRLGGKARQRLEALETLRRPLFPAQDPEAAEAPAQQSQRPDKKPKTRSAR